MKELIWEIALFLRDKEESSTYCFFYRKEGTGAEADWFLASAKLNACSKGFPEEIVVVSYNLQLLGDQKNRIYRVLNNGDFFKKHFSKVAALTKREKEVVRLLAAGMNSSEIAGTLCVSMHTVQAHRKNIIKKLDIRNFAGLLKFAEVFDLMSPNEHECPVN
ncbi:response regulator transcription factor [Anseongella ginsenosidimutans]|nr:helix-turn-helix transcriptional regulator [Anseongella ginsenosidimutans]